MGYSTVRRCSYDVETTFGTDQAEAYKDLPMLEGSYRPRLAQGALPDLAVVQSLHHRNAHRRGSQFGAGFSADFNLDGLPAGLAAAVAYSAPQTGMAGLLKAWLGGVVGNSGSLVDSASGGGAASTTSIPVTVGQGARFTVGTYIMISGVPRKVTAVAADRLTLNFALPTAPSDGVVVYNSVTLYPDPTGVGTDGQSLLFRLLGDEAEDQTIYRGCVPVVTGISAAIDEIITAQVEVMAATWATTTGETLGTASVVGGGGLPAIAGRLWTSQIGGTLNGALAAHRFEFRPGLGAQPARGYGSATAAAIQTVMRYRQQRQQAVLEAAVRFHSQADWDDHFDYYHSLATTQRPTSRFILQWGNTPIASGAGTGCVVIGMPAAFWDSAPEHVEADGEIEQVMRFAAAMDYAPATAGALINAPWTISLF